MFAYECTIYYKIRKHNENLKLQEALGAILNWCKTWQMKLNYDKAAVTTVSCKKEPIQFNYLLEGQPFR